MDACLALQLKTGLTISMDLVKMMSGTYVHVCTHVSYYFNSIGIKYVALIDDKNIVIIIFTPYHPSRL